MSENTFLTKTKTYQFRSFSNKCLFRCGCWMFVWVTIIPTTKKKVGKSIMSMSSNDYLFTDTWSKVTTTCNWCGYACVLICSFFSSVLRLHGLKTSQRLPRYYLHFLTDMHSHVACMQHDKGCCCSYCCCFCHRTAHYERCQQPFGHWFHPTHHHKPKWETRPAKDEHENTEGDKREEREERRIKRNRAERRGRRE